MRILVVEDDRTLADGLSRSLSSAGHSIDVVGDGLQAEASLGGTAYDLVILDLQLPNRDGLDVLRGYRSSGGLAPVMILTARNAVADRVRGLDAGADDYFSKPFDLPELEARVRSLLRRASGAPSPMLRHGALTLDTNGRCAEIDGRGGIDLSAREFALLETLMLRMGRVVSKSALLEKLYGADDQAGENAVEVFIHRLRRKLEPAGVAIRTIRGLGYMIDKLPRDS